MNPKFNIATTDGRSITSYIHAADTNGVWLLDPDNDAVQLVEWEQIESMTQTSD